MSEDLRRLRAIINSSIDTVLQACEARGVDFPKLDNPADESEFTADGIRNDARVAVAISLAVAAAGQMIATLQPPAMTMYTSATKVIPFVLFS